VALVTVCVMALSVRVITMSAMSVGVVAVSSVSVRVVTVMIVAGCEKSVSCVVVGHVSKCSVLDVPTEEPFLRKRSRILH
jgi:hypothetical protein